MLLEAKFKSPKRIKYEIDREMLLADVEASGERLVILHATSGFGKTTLMNAYSRKPGVNAAWYRMGKPDNSFPVFFRYLCASIQRAWPEFYLETQVKEPGELGYLFLNSLYQASEKRGDASLAIMLDDFQVVNEADILHFLSLVMFHAPDQVRFFLATSGETPQFAVRYLLCGDARVLSGEQLGFRRDEVKQLMLLIGGERLADQARECARECNQIFEYTEGWPAGTMFLCQYMEKKNGILDFSELMTGGQEFMVQDFIAYEVFRQLPEYLRTFLIQTSPLEEMTASLCDAVTDGEDSDLLLERLMAKGLFISRITEPYRSKGEPVHYRYYPLFRAFLLGQLSSEKRKQLCSSTAQTMLRLGQKDQALSFAVVAGNRELVLDLLLMQGISLYEQGSLDTLESCFSFLKREEQVLPDHIQLVRALYLGKRGKRSEERAILTELWYHAAAEHDAKNLALSARYMLDCLASDGKFAQASEFLERVQSRLWPGCELLSFHLSFWQAVVMLLEGREKEAETILLAIETWAAGQSQSELLPDIVETRRQAAGMAADLKESSCERLHERLRGLLHTKRTAADEVWAQLCLVRILNQERTLKLDEEEQKFLNLFLADRRTFAFRAEAAAVYGFRLCCTGSWERGTKLLLDGVKMLSSMRLNLANGDREGSLKVFHIYAMTRGGYRPTANGSHVMAYCFGNFRIVDMESGREVKWRTRKARECMAYLIHIQGKRVSREELMDVLWESDSFPKKEVTAFHNILSSIRKSLEPFGLRELLEYQDKKYFVNPDAIFTEIRLMREVINALETGNARKITGYEGIMDILADRPYMENVDASWNLEARGYCERNLYEGLIIDGNTEIEWGDYARGRHFLERALELSPYEEDAVLALLNFYGKKGDLRGLETFYRKWCRRQREEFPNWKPDLRILETYRDNRRRAGKKEEK